MPLRLTIARGDRAAYITVRNLWAAPRLLEAAGVLLSDGTVRRFVAGSVSLTPAGYFFLIQGETTFFAR